MNARERCLRLANECVNLERVNSYGEPENNFGLIGQLWTNYLGTLVTCEDVALMMILLKVARQKTGSGKADNLIDICGYSACVYELLDRELERQKRWNKGSENEEI